MRTNGLCQVAGVGVAELLTHGGPRQQLGRPNHPAHAQARAQYLAEATAVHQVIAAAAHLLAQRQQAGRRRPVKVELAIGVVFHDQGARTRGQFEHTQATLQAQGCAAGVAEGGNQVNQFRFVLGNQLLQPVHVHTVGINRRADQVCAIQAKALDGGQKGRRFHNHLVARRDHGFTNQVQRLLAASRDDQILGRHRCALARHEVADLLAQRAPAFGRAILQHRASVVGQHGVRRYLQAFHVKQSRVWEPPGKADDARLAQQLE